MLTAATTPLSVYCVQYEHAWLNKLERSALSINVLTLLFGTGLHTNEQAGESRNAALAELLSVGIVFLNVVFVGNVARSWRRHGQYCARCRKEAAASEDTGTEEEKEIDAADGQAQRQARRRVNEAVPGPAAGTGQRRPMAGVRSRMGQVGRSGTIRGSLRYNVGVAIQLKKAQRNVSTYAETLKARQECTQQVQTASLSRLQSRLKIRKANSRAKILRQRGAA